MDNQKTLSPYYSYVACKYWEVSLGRRLLEQSSSVEGMFALLGQDPNSAAG